MNSTSGTTDPLCMGALCIFYAVANVIIFILGVAGNGLVIWIVGFKAKKSVVNTWYLSLALSDFLFCGTLPFSIIHIIKQDWIFGLFMCKFMFFAVYFNWFSSIFILVIISVDRCVVVKFPVWAQNKRTTRKASVIAVLVWILSAAYCLPSAYSLGVQNNGQNQTKNCFYSYTKDQKTVDVVCDLFLGFVIPFLIIVVCYVVIMRKLKIDQMAKSKKPFKIMTALIVTFVVCWLPYHTFSLMDLNLRKYKNFLNSGYKIALILANGNSCINPFLYTFTGKDFKKQCKTLLSKIENAFEEEETKCKVQGTISITPEDGRHATTVCNV
ncbi:chemerin-like receptor 1 [Salminus brasiliensis]|uniref:chemerin-like receptor 1 n=1 Tax=Salminus brasiliensis TaxID=930266 RepID=UPI003B837341